MTASGNEQGAALAFSIPPAFIQTGWFSGAVCVAAGVIAVWGAGAPTRSVRSQPRYAVAWRHNSPRRERIAGASCTIPCCRAFKGCCCAFHAVAKRLPEGSERQKLSSVIADASQAIGEGRDAIERCAPTEGGKRTLRRHCATLGMSSRETQARARPRCSRVDVHGTPRTLRPIARDEIYRIAREALHKRVPARTTRIVWKSGCATTSASSLCLCAMTAEASIRKSSRGAADPGTLGCAVCASAAAFSAHTWTCGPSSTRAPRSSSLFRLRFAYESSPIARAIFLAEFGCHGKDRLTRTEHSKARDRPVARR